MFVPTNLHYQQNLIPTNRKNFGYPRTLISILNESDSTVVKISVELCNYWGLDRIGWHGQLLGFNFHK